jgi:hypothetical protein
MDQPGLHGRHRDKNGELSKKHGNTLVRTLRKVYGQHFAEACSPDEKLSEVLHKLDESSLSQLVHDHEHGKLYEKVAAEEAHGLEQVRNAGSGAGAQAGGLAKGTQGGGTAPGGGPGASVGSIGTGGGSTGGASSGNAGKGTV